MDFVLWKSKQYNKNPMSIHIQQPPIKTLKQTPLGQYNTVFRNYSTLEYGLHLKLLQEYPILEDCDYCLGTCFAAAKLSPVFPILPKNLFPKRSGEKECLPACRDQVFKTMIKVINSSKLKSSSSKFRPFCKWLVYTALFSQFLLFFPHLTKLNWALKDNLWEGTYGMYVYVPDFELRMVSDCHKNSIVFSGKNLKDTQYLSAFGALFPAK